MKLKVFASLSEDINNGWVWVPEGLVGERIVVRLKNKESGKIVFCEALQIGDNFLSRYNTNNRTHKITDKSGSIVMNEWYRKKLGITATQAEVEFDIAKKDNPWSHLRASLHHPQIVIRLSMELAILGFALGLLGLYLGWLGIQKQRQKGPSRAGCAQGACRKTCTVIFRAADNRGIMPRLSGSCT